MSTRLFRDGVEVPVLIHQGVMRFTPEALGLLNFLQRDNDRGEAWDVTARKAFTGNRYWLENRMYGYYPERAFPGPWCTKDSVRHWRGSRHSQYD